MKRESHSKKALDGLVNVVSGLGTNKAKRSHNAWEYDLLGAWQQLDAAYQTNWIARQICDVPARDATREWRRIKSDAAEEITALEQHFTLPVVIEEALSWANLYGGSGVLIMTDQDLEKPLNLNRIKKGSLKRFLVFDRHDLTASTLNTTDILAENYLQPDYYNVLHGNQRIHWTHVARFNGERIPRRQQMATQGWGDSSLRKCIEDVADMVAAKGGIAELMQEANIDVIKREGLSDELASDQDDLIIARYEAFAQMKSIINMALLDDKETLERQTLNLSGVAPIIELFMTWISGAARMPVTKLFGTSAKGMSATGEGDADNYNDDVRSIQTSRIAMPLRLIDEVMVRSAVGSFPDDFDYTWNPLEQPNEVEIAQAETLRAQKSEIYLNSGIITHSQVQRVLQSNEEYQFDDDKIAELEEIEDANMFEEMPTLGEGGGDDNTNVIEGESEEISDTRFIDRYMALEDAGLAHDEIMKRVNL